MAAANDELDMTVQIQARASDDATGSSVEAGT